jgi:hypothetical protein
MLEVIQLPHELASESPAGLVDTDGQAPLLEFLILPK